MTAMNLPSSNSGTTQATIFLLPMERLLSSSGDGMTLAHRADRYSRLLIRRVKELLELHPTHNLRLIEIAAIVGLSPGYVHRLFKRVTGCTLHQYVIERRIETALCLIESSSLPLKEIAIRTGFADQSHFTRHFKRIVGMPPAEFVANYFGR